MKLYYFIFYIFLFTISYVRPLNIYFQNRTGLNFSLTYKQQQTIANNFIVPQEPLFNGANIRILLFNAPLVGQLYEWNIEVALEGFTQPLILKQEIMKTLNNENISFSLAIPQSSIDDPWYTMRSVHEHIFTINNINYRMIYCGTNSMPTGIEDIFYVLEPAAISDPTIMLV